MVVAKCVENHTIVDQKHSFLHYLNYICEQSIPTILFVEIAKTLKMVLRPAPSV